MERLPKVSVLMPVYNCAAYVLEAVQSILDQTFTDFELIVIDDVSTDGTLQLLRSVNDPRIRLIEKEVNSGLTKSLNIAMELARGEYIARMDGDDVSLPERFKLQVAFLDAHPEVLVVGGQCVILPTGKPLEKPVQHDDILVAMLESNAMVHPSMMMRRVLQDGSSFRYPEGMEPAEDYLLWCRLITRGRFHNLPQPVLMYRLHDGQISRTRRARQMLLRSKTRLELWNGLFGHRFHDMGLFDLYWVQATGNDVVLSFLAAMNELDLILIEKKAFGISNNDLKYVIHRRRKKLIQQFFMVPGIHRFRTVLRCRSRWVDIFHALGFKRMALFLLKSILHQSAVVTIYPNDVVQKELSLLKNFPVGFVSPPGTVLLGNT
jgi:glycosyltransferase involved in cell wall biosynthesis